MAGVRKTGDWNRVAKMLEKIGDKFRDEIRRATDKNGRLIEATMVGHFEAQDLPWPALSPRYLARKAREGYSTEILIRTGTLLQNIRYHRTKWNEGWIGVLRNVTAKDGVSLVNIAAVHEFGTRKGNIPARPFVAPTAKETADEVKENYEDAIEEAIK